MFTFFQYTCIILGSDKPLVLQVRPLSGHETCWEESTEEAPLILLCRLWGMGVCVCARVFCLQGYSTQVAGEEHFGILQDLVYGT